jgi:RimJ/RimL family protein N-acetyltransferase
MKIRNMLYEDLGWLHSQMDEHWQDMSVWRKDRPTISDIRDMYYHHKAHGCILVAELQSGEKAGLVSALNVVNDSTRTDEVVVTHWWVVPGHRGGKVGYALLKAMLGYAEERSVTITLAKESKMSENSMMRLGFSPVRVFRRA